MIKLAIAGICGRMGTAILKLALTDPEFEIVGGLERANHPMVGKGLDALHPGASVSCRIGENPSRVIDTADVVIDFTEPASSLEHFRIATDRKKAIVIGTTGLPQSARDEISRTGGAKVVMSPNMSIGVNLMFELVKRAASVLKSDYDIEILELHHKWKKDAPSGTAIRLREAVESVRSGTYQVSGREGNVGERKTAEIGVFGLRGGDIVGEHTVFFAGIGERLEITHRAASRDNFARGSLLAAKWLVGQRPGIYDMRDVLGIE